MKEIIKRKELKGIFSSLLLIVLACFLIYRPLEIVNTLIKIMGIVLLVFGLIDFLNFFRMSDEEKLINYGLVKGITELSIGILFIFKFETLTDIFSIIIGLIIIFINIFKLQLSLSLKDIGTENWFIGTVIATLSIILGVIIILNPFESAKVVIITSGAILLVSELSNIIYSILVLSKIRKLDKVVKEIIVKEEA